MDIKSKSNNNLNKSNKLNVLIALVLVVAFALGFMGMYPFFASQAKGYDKGILASDRFLYDINRANFVLYKDMEETVQGKNLTYKDLYLTIEESPANDVNIDVFADFNGQSFTEIAEENMEDILYEWKVYTMDGLAKEIDYCVIDHETGKVIKNTGNAVDMVGVDETVDAIYQDYVRISFDDAGMLESVSVKSIKPEDLIKSVQRVMKDNQLTRSFWQRSNYYGSYEDESVYYIKDDGYYKAKLHIESAPKGVTFCYALTSEQKEALTFYYNTSNMRATEYRWQEAYSYYLAGTGRWMMVMLGVLTVLTLLLTRWKRYTLHRSKFMKLHVEFSTAALIFWFAISTESGIGLVNYTNRGYFNDIFAKNLGGVSENLYPVITGAINVLFLSFLFGGWYYIITTFGELFDLGIKQFLRERSLIVKWCLGIHRFTKKQVRNFKDEVLHVDLGEKLNKTIFKLVAVNFIVLAAICIMWMFGWFALVIYSFLLYFGLKRYVAKIQEQYKKLLEATHSIADGNLHTEVTEDWGVFESYKKELLTIQSGFSKAVEEEVKSQRMKTELISNVSHDLKTPLTAITTYTELLKDENITSEQRKEYLDVLERKSLRLKTLIEDLFEVSKASSGNVTLNIVDVDICNLMRQVYLEYEDKVEEADLIFRFRMPEEKIILQLDSQKTYRVFENLYTNIIKYAMPHTRVYVDVEKTQNGVAIELKNMSKTELNIAPESLMERFVRGDSSRTDEGSGLGLAIARNFVNLQKGEMEIGIDGDLFKVTIEF